MDKYKLYCGNCRKKLTFGAKLLGKAIDCPNCKAVIAIPANLQPVPPKPETLELRSDAAIPNFQPPPKEGDSIFDTEPPPSVLDMPKPKPVVPTEPLPAADQGNPFAFDTGTKPAAVADNSVEITAEANPFRFAETPAAPAEPPKAKQGTPLPAKAGRSKPAVEIDNPFSNGTAETVAEAKASSQEPAPAAASKTYGAPKQRTEKGKLPLITWIFLAWAVLATGAAIFFAMKKPTPAPNPAPVPEKAAPAKEPEKKTEKPAEKKTERKGDKKQEKPAEKKDDKSAMEKDEMKK